MHSSKVPATLVSRHISGERNNVIWDEKINGRMSEIY